MNKLERKKRLGQYFTSSEVAKLLLHLTLNLRSNIVDAIDPMMGKGVFISAIEELNPSIKTYGIELDTTLKGHVKGNFKNTSRLLFGSAFNYEIIKKLNKNQFDLVITNPPYVRHLNQTTEDELEEGVTVPSGSQVRNSLLDSIRRNSGLTENESSFLIDSAMNYSGLSDLSVPSVIQCASLTKVSGIIGLLIPESCITREYSITTLNVLFRLFDIKLIVKDEGRNWFDDAQVKTLLILGKKLNTPRESALSHPDIPVIEITNSTPKKPLGNLIDAENFGEFAKLAMELNDDLESLKGKYYKSASSYIAPLVNSKNLIAFPQFKALIMNKGHNGFIHPTLSTLTNCNKFILLADILVNVHQGLRTGANNFFYCDMVEENGAKSIVYVKRKDSIEKIEVPTKVIRPVLRKQNEINSENVIARNNLKGRLFDLGRFYTPYDITRFKISGANVNKLPEAFSDHIKYCEKVNIGTIEKPKYYPELSAVKTNVSRRNGIIKTWYQIPGLKNRHMPDICIPRVNSGLVRAYVVEKGVVVDANFININIDSNSLLNKYGVLALLNSEWVRVQLELNGNILGGGALKLDKTHLNSLVLPKEIPSIKNSLERLGELMTKSPQDIKVNSEINELINSLLGISNPKYLQEMIHNRLKMRSKNG